MVACGKLSTSAQCQLLEDVGEMGLHGRLGDPESSRGLEIAEPIDHEVHDLLLASAQALAKASFPGGGLTDRAASSATVRATTRLVAHTSP